MLPQCCLLSLAQLAKKLVAQQLTEVCWIVTTDQWGVITLLHHLLSTGNQLDAASETSEDQFEHLSL